MMKSTYAYSNSENTKTVCSEIKVRIVFHLQRMRTYKAAQIPRSETQDI
jgi:hypothetical protein